MRTSERRRGPSFARSACLAFLAAGALAAGDRPAAAAPAADRPDAEPTEERCAAGQRELGGGAFVSRRGAPKEELALASFCLDVTEVTVAAYRACVEDGGCSEPDVDAGEACNWREAAARGAHPINCVAHPQAAAYCAWRGQRLPTAVEIEWAQRGGERATTYPWGRDASPRRVCAPRRAAPLDPRAPVTCPVAACATSDGAGLHDLSGNLAEWTATAAPGGERLVCGGQTVCGARLSRLPAALAAGACFAVPLSSAREGVGFRCASAPK